jgi:hypothetical protein
LCLHALFDRYIGANSMVTRLEKDSGLSPAISPVMYVLVVVLVVVLSAGAVRPLH